MIQVQNLNFEYYNHKALENINVTIPEGSITAIVGPNGAGKTTLMRCICALSRPTSGNILMDNFDVSENPHKTHSLCGYLADNFGLYEKLTVTQAFTYYAEAHSLSNIENRVREIISMINLENKSHEAIQNLSRGMRQRVGIGQSIIHSPKYLILDEPASGLDPEARIHLADLFKVLNANGTTLLVSSHILAELDQYANNLLILRDGKIVDQNIMNDEFKNIRYTIHAINITIENIPEEFKAGYIQINNDKATLELPIDFNQSALLKHLIMQDLEVKEIYSSQKNIQETYLETIKIP